MSERALEGALQLYRKGRADFADGLHVALAAQAGEAPLRTFDKSAARLIGAQWLRVRQTGKSLGRGGGRRPQG